MSPHPAPSVAGPVVLVVAGGAVSQAAIARTAELAAGALVTVVGVGSNGMCRTTEPEQVRRTVALAMSVLESTGIVAVGHIVTGSPARAVARVARARGARVVILDQPGPSCGGQPAVGLMAELRRRMYGSGTIVLAETDRRGGWVSA